MDISLDLDKASPTYKDLKLVNGDLVLCTGKDEITQNILQRLSAFLGEWFLDNTVGLPYFQQILIKNPDQSKIDAIFRNAILGTPGVLQLNTYDFSVDLEKRNLSIEFAVKTTRGSVDYTGTVAA